MTFENKATVKKMIRPGIVSSQLISSYNCKEAKLTLTDVTVEPGCIQPRHFHKVAEQTYYALEGSGTLLLANDQERSFCTGDVARFAPGEVHGLRNDGSVTFRYVSATTPPQDFSDNYDKVK